jgi:hypothetical protein
MSLESVMSEKIKETISSSDVGGMPAGIVGGDTHDVTCMKCRKVTVVPGAAQSGQNYGHYICEPCQTAYDKTEIKKALESASPTVKVDGRAAQSATLAGK